MAKEKLPINITFEIVQHQPPNDHWYDVTAVLSWPDAVPEPFYQRMDTALVTQNELDGIKATICILVRQIFDIQEVKTDQEG